MELDKDYHLLYDAKIKLETQFEMLQDQLQREENERQNLTSVTVVPRLQEVITLIEQSNRAAEPSGAQQILKKINNLMHEQARHDVRRRNFRSHPFGDSMQSLVSDTSSVADVTVEEEVARNGSATNDIRPVPATQNKISSGKPSKSVPVITNTKPMTPAKSCTAKSTEHAETPAAYLIQRQAASKERPMIASFQTQDLTESKEPPQIHVRSDSTPASDWNKTHSIPRKQRHHSVSGASENSIKREDLSQSLKQAGDRRRKITSPGSHAYLQSDELQSRLEKQRKRIESSSEVVNCKNLSSQ